MIAETCNHQANREKTLTGDASAGVHLRDIN